MVDYKKAFENLSAKYEAEHSKYNTRITRKACLIVGGICFVAGFLAKALAF